VFRIAGGIDFLVPEKDGKIGRQVHDPKTFVGVKMEIMIWVPVYFRT
jgi:hypothetical protein